MKPQIIFGFHAVGARLRTRPESVREIYVDAKREDTRARRISQAVEWLAEGKSRNWKYENC